jgi:hypothetical protein
MRYAHSCLEQEQAHDFALQSRFCHQLLDEGNVNPPSVTKNYSVVSRDKIFFCRYKPILFCALLLAADIKFSTHR